MRTFVRPIFFSLNYDYNIRKIRGFVMEEYTRYGKSIMKNIRKILLEYKKEHKLTNQQMAVLCDISLSEYDKIMNVRRHSDYGCVVDTVYRISLNLGISVDKMIRIDR